MCEHGDTVPMEITIPANLSRTGFARLKTIGVDRCLAPIIRSLNDAGVLTDACCCGHGKRPGNIALADGRMLDIYPDWDSWRAAQDKLKHLKINE